MAYTANLRELVMMEWELKQAITYTVGPSNMDATLHYVNLGLKKLPETSFGVSQDIQKVDIFMTHSDNSNNPTTYQYTYYYGKNKQKFVQDKTAPTVKWQNRNDYDVYSADIYPSDVGYSHEKDYHNDGIEVYVTYRIDIINTVTYDISELYMESEFWIERVENTFDTSKYKLDDKNWQKSGNNKAVMNENYLKECFRKGDQGIPKYKQSDPNACVKTAEIRYRVTDKDAALDELISTGEIIDHPTRVDAKGYHKYKRLEHTWTQEGKTLDHKTESITRNNDAPGMKFKLGDDRKFSGKVFEDNISNDVANENTGEKLGNGKCDDGENSLGGVKVELINIKGINSLEALENASPTRLYTIQGNTVNPSDTAEEITKEDGKYEFVGVLPGMYILRFTYGDGTKTYSSPTSGPNGDVTIDKYKSTIVTEATAKEALRYADPNFKKAPTGTDPTDDFWYRRLDKNAQYSVAVDDKKIRKDFNNGGDSTREHRGASNISEIFAYSDIMDISIENQIRDDNDLTKEVYGYADDKGDSVNYTHIVGMNLGVAKQPKHELTLDKVITNVKLTNAQNNVIIEGNPQETLPGVSDLDMKKDNGGSTFTRIESDEEQITELVPTYTITITDVSDIVYYSLDEAHENWYYDFGEHSPSYSRIIAINPSEVLDYLDPSLEYMTTIFKYNRGKYFKSSTPGRNTKLTNDSLYQYKIEGETEYRALGKSKGYDAVNLQSDDWSLTDEKTQQLDLKSGKWKGQDNTHNKNYRIDNYVSAEEDETEYKYRTLLDFTKMNSLIKEDNIVLTVTAKRVFQSDDDTETLNSAQITIGELPKKVVDNPLVQKVILAKDNDNGAYSTTKITITPPTGEDKKSISIYIITGISALVVFTTGVILIKKKVL